MTCDFSAQQGYQGAVVVDRLRVARVTSWSMSLTCESLSFTSSGTVGWKGVIPSILSASGSIEFKHDIDTPQIQPLFFWPGWAATLILIVNAQRFSSNPDHANFWYLESATFSEVALTVDIDTGDMISGSCNFNSNGRVNPPSGHYGEGPDYTEILAGRTPINYDLPGSN